MTQDSTHSIFSSAKRFLSGTMLSRVTGMLRDIAMASAFGTQEAVAAFMVAFRFSHLLRRLFGEGALQTAFIPHFEELRKENPQRAGSFFFDLVATLSLGLMALIFIIMIVLGGVLLFCNLSEGNYEIVFLTLLMMPSLLFICLFGLNASLLQCERRFFITGAAPAAFNMIWILGVCLLWNFSETSAMPWLAAWVIIACFFQWIITVPSVIAILNSYKLEILWKNIRLISKDVRNLGKPLMLGVVGVAASQINSALDAVFARYADASGPAFLWYAIRLQQLPLALFGIAISGALLPPLSRALKANDMLSYRLFLEFSLRRSLTLMIPITAFLFVMGDSCVNLIYGRGDFTDLSSVGTTLCLWGYNFGLIPMTLVLILAPAYYSKGDYNTPTIASAMAIGGNFALNTLFIPVLGFGVLTVALSTSVSAWINLFLLSRILREHLSTSAVKSLAVATSKLIGASGAAIMAVIVVDGAFLHGSSSWIILQGQIPIFPHAFIEKVSHFTIQSVVFMFIFGAAAWLFKCTDLFELLGRQGKALPEPMRVSK